MLLHGAPGGGGDGDGDGGGIATAAAWPMTWYTCDPAPQLFSCVLVPHSPPAAQKRPIGTGVSHAGVGIGEGHSTAVIGRRQNAADAPRAQASHAGLPQERGGIGGGGGGGIGGAGGDGGDGGEGDGGGCGGGDGAVREPQSVQSLPNEQTE